MVVGVGVGVVVGVGVGVVDVVGVGVGVVDVVGVGVDVVGVGVVDVVVWTGGIQANISRSLRSTLVSPSICISTLSTLSNTVPSSSTATSYFCRELYDSVTGIGWKKRRTM